MSGVEILCKILRGATLILVGAVMIMMPTSCDSGKAKTEGEKSSLIYSDLNYSVVQGEAMHKPGSSSDKEYVFVPLTLKNSSDNNIIFSSEVCIKAYAIPSGEDCSHSDKSAIASAKENVKDFVMFDGIIHCHEDTLGWLIFEVPLNTEAVYVDFYTGYNQKEFISFTCQL